MTTEELEKAFDEAMSDGLKVLEGKTPTVYEQLIIVGITVLREYIVDHKRAADALERIATVLEAAEGGVEEQS